MSRWQTGTFSHDPDSVQEGESSLHLVYGKPKSSAARTPSERLQVMVEPCTNCAKCHQAVLLICGSDASVLDPQLGRQHVLWLIALYLPGGVQQDHQRPGWVARGPAAWARWLLGCWRCCSRPSHPGGGSSTQTWADPAGSTATGCLPALLPCQTT